MGITRRGCCLNGWEGSPSLANQRWRGFTYLIQKGGTVRVLVDWNPLLKPNKRGNYLIDCEPCPVETSPKNVFLSIPYKNKFTVHQVLTWSAYLLQRSNSNPNMLQNSMNLFKMVTFVNVFKRSMSFTHWITCLCLEAFFAWFGANFPNFLFCAKITMACDLFKFIIEEIFSEFLVNSWHRTSDWYFERKGHFFKVIWNKIF